MLLQRIEKRLIRDEAAVADLDPSSSDFDLNPEVAHMQRRPDLRRAAVLIPFIDRGDRLTVLLTRRAAHLSAHAGQISFPGGRLDDADEGFVDAALREAEEEISLDRSCVEIQGLLDPYETVTGFHVVPVVGLVRAGVMLKADPSEVAEIFEVPASFLMDPANHETHTREFRGQTRVYYAIPYGDYYIWGATAAIIIQLHRRLFET